jgi:hypothetical protein
MRVADPSCDFTISIRNYHPEEQLEVKVWLDLTTGYGIENKDKIIPHFRQLVVLLRMSWKRPERVSRSLFKVQS